MKKWAGYFGRALGIGLVLAIVRRFDGFEDAALLGLIMIAADTGKDSP